MASTTGDSAPLQELTVREVGQALREVTFGRRTMSKVGGEPCAEVHAGHLAVDVEGWRITLHSDCDTLD